MTIYKPQLVDVNSLQNMPLTVTHPYHMVPNFEDVLKQGSQIADMGNKIGADAVTRDGTFSEAMLNALDKVSASEQLVTGLEQAAIIDPESVDAHDITIAQAEASMALNIARNVLSRIVQGWKDIINTR
jgi:flagellar hook-basal body complex protein FliE